MKTPTHILTIAVPLCVDGTLEFSPLEDAIRTFIPLTRLGLSDSICGEFQLTVAEVTVG